MHRCNVGDKRKRQKYQNQVGMQILIRWIQSTPNELIMNTNVSRIPIGQLVNMSGARVRKSQGHIIMQNYVTTAWSDLTSLN